jgi:hypothetical protein
MYIHIATPEMKVVNHTIDYKKSVYAQIVLADGKSQKSTASVEIHH